MPSSRNSRPSDIARSFANARDRRQNSGVGQRSAFLRETFSLPRSEARLKAREFLDAFPAAAYMSAVESWRELPGDVIEFTMRRLPTAD